MKNKRKVEDILHSVSDDEMEKITSEYPDADKKKMNAIYREIERRVETGNDDFSGDSVSGVERYNRNIVVRRAAVQKLSATPITLQLKLSAPIPQTPKPSTAS